MVQGFQRGVAQRDRQVRGTDVDTGQSWHGADLVERGKPSRRLDHRVHARPRLVRGRVETEARPQRAEAAHTCGRVAGGGHRGGRLFGGFDHGDDDRVGTRVEHAADRRGVGGTEPHRGGDRDVLEPAQQQGDVGVVEIAVLDVESDVVVAGLRRTPRAR